MKPARLRDGTRMVDWGDVPDQSPQNDILMRKNIPKEESQGVMVYRDTSVGYFAIKHGYNMYAIARELNCCHQTIFNRFQKLHLKAKGKATRKDIKSIAIRYLVIRKRMTFVQVAKKLGCTAETVRKRCEDMGIARTKYVTDKVFKALFAKYTQKRIADILEVHWITAHRRAIKLGLVDTK